MTEPTTDPERVARLRAALLSHYDRSQRDLPWRRDIDPYRILVSEIMLQQTRVDTVLEYYEAWLARFPDLVSLADADLEEVNKAWEGLGYYRRARNLHAAARVIRDGDGRVPGTPEGLRALPGVGEYTAGAVASIAFGIPVPAVDGNVRRVLARLFGRADPGSAWLREAAGALVDPDRPGDWNQALMDLGATVCTPRRPLCNGCPWSDDCIARSGGDVLAFPAATARRSVRTAHFALAVVSTGSAVLLQRRSAEGLLAGLWGMPEEELSDTDPSSTTDGAGRAAVLGVAAELGVRLADHDLRPLPPVRHRFTHIDAHYHAWVVPVEPFAPPEGTLWLDLDAAEAPAMPVAQQKILELLRASVTGTEGPR